MTGTGSEEFLVALIIGIAIWLIYHIKDKGKSLLAGHIFSIVILLLICVAYWVLWRIDEIPFNIHLVPFMLVVVMVYFYTVIVEIMARKVSERGEYAMLTSVVVLILLALLFTEVLFFDWGLEAAKLHPAVTYLGALIATAIVILPNLGEKLTGEE